MNVFTRILLAAIAALPVVPSTGLAQMPGVHEGARIRSSAGTGWRGTGTVLQAGGDSLVVNSDATGTPVVLRRADMGLLEIRDGERRSTLKGFTVGTLAGAGAGALLGFSGGKQECTRQYQAAGKDCSSLKTPAEIAVGAAVFLGILGGSIGTAVGFVKTSDRWVAIGANGVALSPIIGGDGHFGVSLRF